MGKEDKFVTETNPLEEPIKSRLSGILEPVKPNPNFVNNLRERIQVVQHPAIIQKFSNIQFVAILVAGIVSAVVLTTMLARFIVNLLFQGKPPTSEESL